MSAMLPSFVATLGWALINFLWQGTLVGMTVAIALILLRNARPQTRYAVSCAALCLCLALPMAGVWRGLRIDASFDAQAVASVEQFVDGSVQPSLASPASWQSASWQSALQDRLPWVVALWSLGAGLLALRMALGMAWVGRIGRSRSGAIDRSWQARLDRIATVLGLQRDIRLRVIADRDSVGLDSPVAAGWWRPMVLVPAALVARMPTDLLEALLAHELAHIKRHDYLVNLIQSAIEALLFYHPVVWWLSRRIRIEREQIADDLAATALGEPRLLALALHELDRYQLERNQFGNDSYSTARLLPAANGGNLMSRIQRLLRPNQHALNWRMALPIIGMAAACLTVYAHDGVPAVATATSATSAAPAIVATTPITAAAEVATPASGPVVAVAAVPRPNPAAKAKTRTRIDRAPDRQHDSYTVVRAHHDNISMYGDSRDQPAIEKARQKAHGDFVWVRRGQKTYVVQDPDVVARVIAAWKPAEDLGKQMEALGAKMEIPRQRMEALGKQIAAVSENAHPYDEAMEKTSAQMQALGRQQEAIGEQMGAVGSKIALAKAEQRDALERQMDALRAQMEPLRQQMETLGASMREHAVSMEHARLPMEDFRRQMEEAGKPIRELGEQMRVLGKQEEQRARQADQAVKAAIDDALQNGKAMPADSAEPN
jgi:beta-lactamase regulating signal transducer with metallopeptidase domain